MQIANDPVELRKACRESDLELMDTLVTRMRRRAIDSGAIAIEGVVEDIGGQSICLKLLYCLWIAQDLQHQLMAMASVRHSQKTSTPMITTAHVVRVTLHILRV